MENSSSKSLAKVRCNNCDWHSFDDDPELICPNCKTDSYLMDIDGAELSSADAGEFDRGVRMYDQEKALAKCKAHTAGPWHHHVSRIPEVYDGQEHYGVYARPTDGTWKCVGDIELGMTPEAEANARLIAAAPELLKSLKAMIDAADDSEIFDHDLSGCDDCILCDARRAVASAES